MSGLRKPAAIGAALGVACVIAIASPAFPHSSDVTGVAKCVDGTYTVDWTVTTSNVPESEEGEVKVISPVNVWLFEWAEHKANHGLEPLAPNAGFTWSQTGIPGDATTAGVTFQIDWRGHSSDPEGTITLPGNCVAPVVEPPVVVEPPAEPPVDTVPVETPAETSAEPPAETSEVESEAPAEEAPAQPILAETGVEPYQIYLGIGGGITLIAGVLLAALPVVSRKKGQS